MQFNQYNLYSYAAGAGKQEMEEKILVDLKHYDILREFCDIEDYTTDLFGDFHGIKNLDYPGEVKVLVQREENSILVAATQKDKQIFGKMWKYEYNDDVVKE